MNRILAVVLLVLAYAAIGVCGYFFGYKTARGECMTKRVDDLLYGFEVGRRGCGP